jgi:AcrR family transcriptional regulator
MADENPKSYESSVPCEIDRRLDRAKRRQIVQGANHVFLSQGFDAASMGAIAQRAGVSKGTLYVYFKSKEELFAAIVEDARLQQAERIFAFDDDQPVEDVLTKLGIGLATMLTSGERMSSFRTVVAIANRMPEIGARFYNAGPAQGIAILKAYLDRQISRGVLVPHDTELAAAQFMDSSLSMTFKPMMFNATTSSNPDVIARVVAMAVETYLRAWRVQQ